MKYTLETLLAGNKTYDFYHHLHEQDVAKVNRLIDRIEASRTEQTTPAPLDGDAVMCLHPTEGEVSADARLEKRSQIEICVYPSIPFINENLHTSTSGGDWWNWSEEAFIRRAAYIGRESHQFKTWGRWGPCGNGAITFRARVHVWQLTDSHFRKF